MSDLVREVTPLTRAIIWLAPPELKSGDSNYKSVDYLLDGLLTATYLQSGCNNQVILGKNFSKTFYVLVALNNPSATELESFLSLVKKDLKAEEKVLVVDEQGMYEKFLGRMPKDLQSRTHLYR